MSNRIVMLRTRDLINQIPKLAKWGIPLVIGGGWFVYPALTPSFKSNFGL
eukprot:CAMPEP_0183358790 /NCGR_PEP_ID=MMETSP0164_2-20130417/50313_1 /TAXON_ID=221442 /ORGANISM="Coccolithus pelagicus ssp braarudi, Strain PLY182g" /LENGTH=49 /DNA_ID=CAMNT_0025532747 /DNA_START=29 /DNA_END=178 /DNA_ORIENTATION=-